jgi:hypothetical protein
MDLSQLKSLITYVTLSLRSTYLAITSDGYTTVSTRVDHFDTYSPESEADVQRLPGECSIKTPINVNLAQVLACVPRYLSVPLSMRMSVIRKGPLTLVEI